MSKLQISNKSNTAMTTSLQKDIPNINCCKVCCLKATVQNKVSITSSLHVCFWAGLKLHKKNKLHYLKLAISFFGWPKYISRKGHIIIRINKFNASDLKVLNRIYQK